MVKLVGSNVESVAHHLGVVCGEPEILYGRDHFNGNGIPVIPIVLWWGWSWFVTCDVKGFGWRVTREYSTPLGDEIES